MFHYVTGIPFQSDLHGGAYDDLTLWEQIDEGAHYTPAKKWLFSVPVVLYDYVPRPDHSSTAPELMPTYIDSLRPLTILTTIHGSSPSILLP